MIRVLVPSIECEMEKSKPKILSSACFFISSDHAVLPPARQAARRATNSEGCGLRSSGHLVIVRSVRLSVFQIRSTAKQMLRFTDETVENIGYKWGLGAPHYFSRTFKQVEGISPSEYREKWQSKKAR